ncbi:hypothetical protein K9N68_35125 (plasmid) [Kovacikia minuta CCNUW1]|uniref:hypothetical protein n=1 Tax=Kovacikia minuta TaxID=2931930 RepID=UPI001CCE84F4|nr:hypothetical protein [Kovacikia minuta]UBF30432.1 hypothetical protein K9N68_35125 [Kovacikia minuta CCNUW1]
MMYHPGESQSALEKWQLGMDRLAKSEAEPALLGLAMSSIHGALEDQFRQVLAALPQLSTAERIRVKDRKEVNWPQLRDRMQKYAGLSDRDARYIMQMNSIRNEAAHGGEFRGSYQDVAAYADFVKKWLDVTEKEWLDIAAKECLHATENSFLQSNRSSSENRCPRCQSIRIKSLELIYHRGISVIERGRGKVQTRQTGSSLQAAPPQKKKYIPAIGPWGLLLGFFLLPFAGFLMLLLLVWFYRVWRFNKIEYPRLMKEWYRTFKCEQCAHTFLLETLR